MIQPLNSYFEYHKAKQLIEMMSDAQRLSTKDIREAVMIQKRIEAYELSPTHPNIIPATKGNV